MIEFLIISLVLPAGISLYKYMIYKESKHKIIIYESNENKYDYDFLLMKS